MLNLPELNANANCMRLGQVPIKGNRLRCWSLLPLWSSTSSNSSCELHASLHLDVSMYVPLRQGTAASKSQCKCMLHEVAGDSPFNCSGLHASLRDPHGALHPQVLPVSLMPLCTWLHQPNCININPPEVNANANYMTAWAGKLKCSRFQAGSGSLLVLHIREACHVSRLFVCTSRHGVLHGADEGCTLT